MTTLDLIDNLLLQADYTNSGNRGELKRHLYAVETQL